MLLALNVILSPVVLSGHLQHHVRHVPQALNQKVPTTLSVKIVLLVYSHQMVRPVLDVERALDQT